MSDNTVTLDQLLASLQAANTSRCDWESNIKITVATSINNDAPIEINLSDTLGKCKKTILSGDDDNYYWLPATFNTNTTDSRKDEIVPYMSQAFAQAGFKVRLARKRTVKR